MTTTRSPQCCAPRSDGTMLRGEVPPHAGRTWSGPVEVPAVAVEARRRGCGTCLTAALRRADPAQAPEAGRRHRAPAARGRGAGRLIGTSRVRAHRAWSAEPAGAGCRGLSSWPPGLDLIRGARPCAQIRGRRGRRRPWRVSRARARRCRQRAPSFGVNGLGAALMVAVSRLDRGTDRSGGRHRGRAGAGRPARKLEAVFGDDAVRRATSGAAPTGLTAWVRDVLDGESRRRHDRARRGRRTSRSSGGGAACGRRSRWRPSAAGLEAATAIRAVGNATCAVPANCGRPGAAGGAVRCVARAPDEDAAGCLLDARCADEEGRGWAGRIRTPTRAGLAA